MRTSSYQMNFITDRGRPHSLSPCLTNDPCIPVLSLCLMCPFLINPLLARASFLFSACVAHCFPSILVCYRVATSRHGDEYQQLARNSSVLNGDQTNCQRGFRQAPIYYKANANYFPVLHSGFHCKPRSAATEAGKVH